MSDILHDGCGALIVNRRTRRKQYGNYVEDLSSYEQFNVPPVPFYSRVGHIVDAISVAMILGEPTVIINDRLNRRKLWVLPSDLKEWVQEHENDSRFPCRVNFYRCGYEGDAIAEFLPRL